MTEEKKTWKVRLFVNLAITPSDDAEDSDPELWDRFPLFSEAELQRDTAKAVRHVLREATRGHDDLSTRSRNEVGVFADGYLDVKVESVDLARPRVES